MIQTLGESVDDSVKEYVFDGACRGRQKDKPGERVGRSLRRGRSASRGARIEQERRQSLVEDVRKGMCGIHSDRSEKWLERLRVEIFDVLGALGRSSERLSPRTNPQPRRDEFVAPAIVLGSHEAMNFLGEPGEDDIRSAAIGSRLANAVLDLLQQAGDAYSTNSSRLLAVIPRT